LVFEQDNLRKIGVLREMTTAILDHLDSMRP